MPVADFGDVTVHGATAALAGAPAKPIAQLTPARLDLLSSANPKNVLATVGPLGKAGNAFTETWVNPGPR